MTNSAEKFDPIPKNQAIYEPLYQEVYQHLFPTLQKLSSRLTELTYGE